MKLKKLKRLRKLPALKKLHSIKRAKRRRAVIGLQDGHGIPVEDYNAHSDAVRRKINRHRSEAAKRRRERVKKLQNDKKTD